MRLPSKSAKPPSLDQILRSATIQGMKQEELTYTALFEPAEEGGYVVTVPALPGLVTQGETLEEAREMAKDAILGYLEALQKDGEPIPNDTPVELEPVKEQIRVAFQPT